eukprot:scaffold48_cov311-Pinguiococcus_pyrenoidosus.AAC.119
MAALPHLCAAKLRGHPPSLLSLAVDALLPLLQHRPVCHCGEGHVERIFGTPRPLLRASLGVSVACGPGCPSSPAF